VALLKKRELKWGQTIKVGYGESYVHQKEADEVVDRLIALGDKMSLEMMRQMLNGLDDVEFIAAHNAFQSFVYEHGLKASEAARNPLTAETPNKRTKSS